MKTLLGHLVLAVLLALIFIAALDGVGISLTDVLAMGKSDVHGYSSYGCKPYTRGMVIHGYAMSMTYGDCTEDAPAKEKDEEPTEPTPIVTDVPDTSTVEPTVTDTPEVVSTPDPVVTEETTPERGNPGNDKPVGNAGEKCDMGGFCERGNEGNRGRGN